MSSDPKLKRDEQAFQIATQQIAALHAIETWGLSLFVTGIGLLTKQFFEWKSQAPLTIQFWSLAPAFIGLFGTYLIGEANKQSREIRRRYAISTEDSKGLGTRGELGEALGFMPLLFGLFCSLFLQFNSN